MTKRELFAYITNYFEENNPDAETELLYKNPYQLLVAVILSAQCTDKRVNLTTPHIFKKYPTILSLSLANFEELFQLIKSISYPNNKTKHLIGMAQKVVNEFESKIPLAVNDLVNLPGVGRKTANVITSVLDNQPNMAVDTHVFRVSARIGLTKNAKNPLQCENQLVKGFDKDVISKAHHWLILHGRYICTARSPKCNDCGLNTVCNHYIKQSNI